MKAKIFKLIFIIVFFSFILTNPIYSQENEKKLKVSAEVTALASLPGMTKLQDQVLEYCRQELEPFRLSKSEKPKWTILLNAREIENSHGDLIVISVTTLQALPKEIIDFCAKNEAFYLLGEKRRKDQLPKEGKFVREYVTSEFLWQFGQVSENELVITNQADIKNSCSKVIKEFLKKFE